MAGFGEAKEQLSGSGAVSLSQQRYSHTIARSSLPLTAYTAPEVVVGGQQCGRAASDAWALGVLSVEMFSGRRYFRSAEAAVEVLRDAATRLPHSEEPHAWLDALPDAGAASASFGGRVECTSAALIFWPVFNLL